MLKEIERILDDREDKTNYSNQNVKFGIVHAGTAEVLRPILSNLKAVEQTYRVAARLGYPYFTLG